MKLPIVIVLCALGGVSSAAEPSQIERDKQLLAPLQSYVGQWRGIGLPKRGSNRGAWSETAEWSWKFAAGRASLVATLQPAKYFARLEVKPDPAQTSLVIDAFDDRSSEKPTVQYRCERTEGSELVATADQPPDGAPARISMRLVAGGDRMFVLYERRLSAASFARLAEVGSTREGSAFAQRAASGPECVVTGGLGTIEVEFEGKSYFVCCGGCKDLFEEDPAGVLADYRERKAAEKAKP